MDLDRRLWAKRLGEGGLDVTDREGSDEDRDHERLEGVGPAHPGPGQPGDDRLLGAPLLRALQVIGRDVVLSVIGQCRCGCLFRRGRPERCARDPGTR